MATTAGGGGGGSQMMTVMMRFSRSLVSSVASINTYDRVLALERIAFILLSIENVERIQRVPRGQSLCVALQIEQRPQ